MRAAVSVHLPARLASKQSDTTGAALAFVGFALESAAHNVPRERLAAIALLLSRLPGAGGLPYERRAIEARFVAFPAGTGARESDEAICYVLGRLAWWGDLKHLRQRAVHFGEHLRALLASTLPECHFRPLLAAEVGAALRPFPWGETGEIRRRELAPAVLAATPSMGAQLPLLGLPDVAGLVDLMLGEPEPTVLAFCLEPLSADEPLDLNLVTAEEGTPPPEPITAVTRRAPTGDALDLEALTELQEQVSQQRLHLQRMAALRQSAYRLRIQLASSGALSETLIASVRGEIGGPGRLTAETAWTHPASPLAGGAMWLRPRTARLAGAQRTEFSQALHNLEHMDFIPWGGATAAAESLADLGEAVRLFPVPLAATWLPTHDTALALPYRGVATNGLRLGLNRVRAAARPVLVPPETRAHHLWIVGQTGTGKSTLLETLVLQDIEADRGVMLIDPHGDLIAQVLGKIPARRIKDVILFDPADTAHPMGINPLVAHNDDEKALVVSAFLALLRKLYDPYNQGITGPRFRACGTQWTAVGDEYGGRHADRVHARVH